VILIILVLCFELFVVQLRAGGGQL